MIEADRLIVHADRGRAALKQSEVGIVGADVGSWRARVVALASQRSREGYMAEVRSEGKGQYLLIEHHCPICEAAESCTGLCAAELDVFRDSLGHDLEVERVAHLLSGDDRCVYRIKPSRRDASERCALDRGA